MLYLMLILLLGFILRIYGINWDQGFHLHPDERMLIMVAERINFPNQLNPDFFNYGSLPIYLLKGISQLSDFLFSTQLANYDGMLYLGRYLSIFFDLGTIVLIYKITNLLFKNNKFSLFSAFVYTIAFFPIQNAHFFVVDVFLTFFTTLLIYLLCKYLSLSISRGHHVKRGYHTKLVAFLGIVFAAMLATKLTAIIFLPIITLILVLNNLKKLKNLISHLSIFTLSSTVFFFLFMPYAFLDYQRFQSDITAQIKMNSDPYIFPYTLQYVGTLPYLYYLKNIFLWGLGPIISVLSFLGLIKLIPVILTPTLRRGKNLAKRNYTIFIFFLFYFFYFAIIGRSAVKFMRYMLPIYPFLTIMAGLGFYKIYSFICHPELARPSKSEGRSGISGSDSGQARMTSRCRNKFGMTILVLLVIGALFWSFMFINIYSQKHTRVAATEWILKNIPYGSTLALEHWDDGLPLRGGENYNTVELTLYDQPDDEVKWRILNETLKQADYIIIASNRLYVPLQKLFDCSKYKSCYPKTAEYYRKLFQEQNVILGSEATPESLLDSDQVFRQVFDREAQTESAQDTEQSRSARMTEVKFKKVAEFAVYPKISINNYQLTINDDSADESFTVYDHPKIFIFKKS